MTTGSLTSDAALAFLVCRASSKATFRSVSEMACTDFGEDSKEKVDLEGETWSVVVSGTSRVVPGVLDNGLVEVDEGRDMVLVADESWVECGILGGGFRGGREQEKYEKRDMEKNEEKVVFFFVFELIVLGGEPCDCR